MVRHYGPADAAAAAEAAFERAEGLRAGGDTAGAIAAYRAVLALDSEYAVAEEWIATLTAAGRAGTLSAPKKRAARASRSPAPPPPPPSYWRHAPPRRGATGGALVLFAGLAAMEALPWESLSLPTEQRADHYAVLRLERSATTEEVRKAFRERSKETHPDRCGTGQSPADCGHEAHLLVTQAAEVLSDVDARAVFDEGAPEDLLAAARGQLAAVVGLVTDVAEMRESLPGAISRSMQAVAEAAPITCGLSVLYLCGRSVRAN